MQKVKLGEIVEITGGYAFKAKDFKNSGIPVIRISDLSGESVTISDSTRRIDEQEINDKYNLKKGDFLIGLSGSIGKLGIVNFDEKAYLNQRVAKITPKNDLNKNYMIYLIQNIITRMQHDSIGGSVKNISPTTMKNYEVLLHSKAEQKRISKVLDQINGLISTRENQLQELDNLTQSIFIKMFGSPVTNEEKWETVKLTELGELGRGKSKHRPRNAPELLDGPYPLIQTGEVSNSGLFITEFESTYSELGLAQSKLWEKGTLCITIAANIAKTGILAFDACFPDSIVGFTPSDKTNVIYIHFWFSFLQKILEENAPQSAQKNINLKILSNLDVINPPKRLQNEFAEKVKEIELIKEKMQTSLDEMNTLFDALMQKAFTGELV